MDLFNLGVVVFFSTILGVIVICGIRFAFYAISENCEIPAYKKPRTKQYVAIVLILGYLFFVALFATSIESHYQNNLNLKSELEANPYTTILLTVEDKAIEHYAPAFSLSEEQPRDHYLVKFTNGDIFEVDIFDYRGLESGKTYLFYYKNFIIGKTISNNHEDNVLPRSGFERFEEINTGTQKTISDGYMMEVKQC